jgi:putative intracellular protease/amidase
MEYEGARVVVLSRSGQEGRGMNQERFQPDGMIIDWNKQPGVEGKYHAVVLVGGKGARKSLWDDPIVPQILTDHYRAGSVVGAMGSALVVLARASLITGEIPEPEEESARNKGRPRQNNQRRPHRPDDASGTVMVRKNLRDDGIVPK